MARRHLGLAVVLGVAVLVQGCAGRAPLQATPMPDDARENPQGYIVVTVRNDSASLNRYAASTPRGYAGYRPYRAGASAIRLLHRVAQQHLLAEVAAWPIELLRVHCVVYRLPPGARREQVLQALQRDPAIESAQALASFDARSATFNDAYASLQRNLVQMNVGAAQQWSRGEGVRVAVVDTGVDTEHPDFGGRLARVRDFVVDGRRRDERHGTAVAGVIAAVPNNGIGIAGIAPGANVMALRACWSIGDDGGARCNSFTLAQALAAAIAARASVVNLSLGGPPDPLLRRIVELGMKRGAVFIGAVPAGQRREGFPTGIDGVIAVGVAGAPRRPNTLLAPGVDVFTLSPRAGYDAASGSSVATAAVTGVAALLLSLRPDLQARQIEAALERSMQPRASAAGDSVGSVESVSVDACRAVRLLAGPGSGCSAGESGDGLARR